MGSEASCRLVGMPRGAELKNRTPPALLGADQSLTFPGDGSSPCLRPCPRPNEPEAWNLKRREWLPGYRRRKAFPMLCVSQSLSDSGSGSDSGTAPAPFRGRLNCRFERLTDSCPRFCRGYLTSKELRLVGLLTLDSSTFTRELSPQPIEGRLAKIRFPNSEFRIPLANPPQPLHRRARASRVSLESNCRIDPYRHRPPAPGKG